MKVYDRILDTIGNTPLVELHNLEKKYALKAKLIAKMTGQSIKEVYQQFLDKIAK